MLLRENVEFKLLDCLDVHLKLSPNVHDLYMKKQLIELMGSCWLTLKYQTDILSISKRIKWNHVNKKKLMKVQSSCLGEKPRGKAAK